MAQSVREDIDLYDDLLNFLSDRRNDVRVTAAEGIFSLSEDQNFLTVCTDSPEFSKKLSHNLLGSLGTTQEISSLSLAALINISHIPSISASVHVYVVKLCITFEVFLGSGCS